MSLLAKPRPQQRSDELRERALRRIPGGVNSNVRLTAPGIFFARGRGAWLWDVDGNDYVDYLLGQGPELPRPRPPRGQRGHRARV